MTSHLSFPKSLIKEFAERRVVVFLGAGASVRPVADVPETDAVLMPPLWSGLISALEEQVPDSDLVAQARELATSGRPLDAAQVLRNHIGAAKYQEVIRELFQRSALPETDIHKAVLRLDPKIVFTTNYDDIYERFCQRGPAGDAGAFKVCRYSDSGVVDDLRTDRRLIFKLHGCVSEPSKTVLTRSDYHRARTDYPGFFKVVEALVLTNTILFVGCSVDADPHLQLFFEAASAISPQTLPHYAIVEEGRWPLAVENALSETLKIDFVTYPNGEHAQIADLLNALADSVDSSRSIPS